MVDTVAQVTDTLSNSTTGAGNAANNAGQSAIDTIAPTIVMVADALNLICVVLVAGGFKEVPVYGAFVCVIIVTVWVLLAVVAATTSEAAVNLSTVADIYQGVFQIAMATVAIYTAPQEKSDKARLELYLQLDQDIRRMVQGGGQPRAPKPDDERRARANAANLQMSLHTLAGKLSHFKPQSPTQAEHWGAAAEHFRKLHLATGKLVLVMRRRHGANPRAAQAIAALQRLQGNSHLTRTKLLAAREAARRS
ncbi:MAG: hypothetical protein ABSD71_15670 [Bacteroidales bacterium]